MRVQELKSSGSVLYSVQTTLPEAGGQVGEVPVAVSWEWLPGAPRRCEGRPACEFVGLHDSSDPVRSAGVQFASGLSPKNT